MFLNHSTILLLEHFHVAAEHRFDGEPLNLRRTAGFKSVIYQGQYFAVLDNVCVCVNRPIQIENNVIKTLPMKDAH